MPIDAAAKDNFGHLAKSFNDDGYAIHRSLLSKEILSVAFRYYASYVDLPGYYKVYEKVKALDRYADALSEALMLDVMSSIEQAIGKSLLPTYSFARIYTSESKLTKHVDHSACEISATVTIGHKNAPGEWPIWLTSRDRDLPVSLEIGDALIYKGTELPHWREPLSSGIWCQAFFHFVDASGPNKDKIFNGRRKLGPTPWSGPASG
ncbi:hypothetical protein FZ025_15195 [Xanthomonas hyacinthi]|uniref:Fe2OG dioxygenase domain-containing protein n=1 Tax=Xanthomonas hyacinthi TaxID=56455 RepID=A0A2S7EN74_9XANT|nr:hypothetical protein [Xanthomonas hyacinthi]PPU92542.1 hypothetical protein XhyaCFBP1156_21025 [Xanthomonas hyacinthi]QGY77912.1 hypothetical protein FZ025_15195 [Xanthomonas hyacinthi]